LSSSFVSSNIKSSGNDLHASNSTLPESPNGS
jgi:hypothetical protein